ncbi:MAG: transcription elongation factor GreA [Fimbriimonadales bacterium]
MASDVRLTRAGFEKLKAELEFLKGPERGRIAEAIREAKSHGDLRENAAYHEAKLNQARLESRIADLEKAVQLAKIVDGPAEDDNSAQLMSKVLLEDMEFGDEFEITLVGSFEADPSKDLISITAPLGAAVLGRVAGEEVQVEAPGGVTHYRIKAIRTEM